MNATLERSFQNDMINQMQAHGWQLGANKDYNRQTALIEQDLLNFVQKTQANQWQKFKGIFPNNTEQHFIEAVVAQLQKADINATDVE